MWTRKLYSKYKVSDLQEENHGRENLSCTMNVLKTMDCALLNDMDRRKGGHKEKTETKASKKDVKKEKT